jgi:hypothetical protein
LEVKGALHDTKHFDFKDTHYTISIGEFLQSCIAEFGIKKIQIVVHISIIPVE